MTYVYTIMPSPVGGLTLVASDKGLCAVLWPDDDPRRVRLGPRVADHRHPLLVETARQLQAYFAKQRQRFELPLDMAGTPFQRAVWAALLRIPFGETRTYAALAREIGCPTAVRAVGAANGRNPVSIIAPCHRVIGTSGALTGFAGGIAAKAKLLALEGHAFGPAPTAASRGLPSRRKTWRTTDLADRPGLFDAI